MSRTHDPGPLAAQVTRDEPATNTLRLRHLLEENRAVALLNMTLPGKMKLSTGVMVLYADEESFTLMTPQGHMFAGWITFSATERPGQTGPVPARARG